MFFLSPTPTKALGNFLLISVALTHFPGDPAIVIKATKGFIVLFL